MLSIRLPDRFDYAKRCLKLRRNPEAPDTVMTMEFLNPLEHWSQCEVALVVHGSLKRSPGLVA